jgi:Protein of unknown function (DUF664)
MHPNASQYIAASPERAFYARTSHSRGHVPTWFVGHCFHRTTGLGKKRANSRAASRSRYRPFVAESGVEPVPRARPPDDAGGRAVLTGFLDYLRGTVVNKVAGLTDEQAFARAFSPSELSPASLVKHLTGVERFWFSIDFAGADLPWPWTEEDPHGNFMLEEDDTLASVVADYQFECERSRQAIAGDDLDDLARGKDMNFTLRWALTHMIEETARHCGHLDLLRERLDGETGE